MAELFGFSIKDRKKKAKVYSPAPPDSDDGTSAVAAGAYFGQYLDLDGVGTVSYTHLTLPTKRIV